MTLNQKLLSPVSFRLPMPFQPQDPVQEAKITKTTSRDCRNSKKSVHLTKVSKNAMPFRQAVKSELWLFRNSSMMKRWYLLQGLSQNRLKRKWTTPDRLKLISSVKAVLPNTQNNKVSALHTLCRAYF